TGKVVLGNRVGTDVSGAIALGNALDGVAILDAPGNTVGGTASGSGNLIAGDKGRGVAIRGAGASGNAVIGNRVGTVADGTAALRNDSDGVAILDAPGNTVGGSASASGNPTSRTGASAP